MKKNYFSFIFAVFIAGIAGNTALDGMNKSGYTKRYAPTPGGTKELSKFVI